MAAAACLIWRIVAKWSVLVLDDEHGCASTLRPNLGRLTDPERSAGATATDDGCAMPLCAASDDSKLRNATDADSWQNTAEWYADRDARTKGRL